MPTRGKLSTKGFEEYLERVVAAGGNVDAAADRALAAGAEVALAGMLQRVPRDSGSLADNLMAAQPTQDGNYHSVSVGLVHPDAETARYGTAQEYGTANMPAHPYIRPALDEDKSKIRAAIRKSLEEDSLV